MKARDRKIVRWLKRNTDFKYPYRTVRAARKAGITIPTALALLEKETGNGRNVWGHDRDSRGNCIPPCGGKVTRRNYRRYKRYRSRYGMQGCGPTQLTWWAYQDRADRAGGCWRPYINMKVGFRILREKARYYGSLKEAYRAYNGTGAAAASYSDQAMSIRWSWQRRLQRAGF